MKFSYLIDSHFGAYDGQIPTGREVADAYEVTLREAELAERFGFDGLTLPERHTRPETYFPSTVVNLAAIAARTERVRLITTVMQPTFHDPMHLAEQIAAIDQLSRGRVTFGVGVGYNKTYFQLFNVPYARRGARFEEAVEVIKGAWEDGRLTHHGEFYDYEDVLLTPKPYQRPRPPIIIGANVDRAIERSLDYEGWVWGMPPEHGEAKRVVDGWRERAAARGNADWTFSLELEGFIGADDARIRKENNHRWLSEFLFYAARKNADNFRMEETDKDAMIAEFERRWLTCGSAEVWIEWLGKVEERLRPEWVNIRMRTPRSPDGPYPSNEEFFEAIQMFGEEVLPHFRES